jgi:glycyl-tRNA synthetase
VSVAQKTTTEYSDTINSIDSSVKNNHKALCMSQRNVSLEQLVALCKRRGFIYPTAEIYGGLNGVYDTGPLGVMMKQSIRTAWYEAISSLPYPVLPFEGSLLGPEAMWDASGHTTNFHDPLVDCLACKHRFRADDIDLAKSCPHCGKTAWTEIRDFQLMFKTQVGATAGSQNYAYLRPETAQSIFVNFKNIMTSNRMKLPFGVAQIGKAFRNEITPKQFLFRMREFEQMELEWFCLPEEAAHFFTVWTEQRQAFYLNLGIEASRIRIRPHEKDELSHYSRGTSDVEYLFPFGWKELEGIANRGDFDLVQHTRCSGKDLGIYDETTKATIYPHVVECSVGVDRLFLTLLFEAYCEEDVEGELRTVLKLHPRVAPIKAAFLPLVKDQIIPMEKIYNTIRSAGVSVQFDASGSIGKRYRRQDEIGTPLCFTYDFESSQDHCVTVRFRDTMQQKRIPITEINAQLQALYTNY